MGEGKEEVGKGEGRKKIKKRAERRGRRGEEKGKGEGRKEIRKKSRDRGRRGEEEKGKGKK